MPNSSQAALYSSIMHYLKAVASAGTDATDPVMERMRSTPIDDFFTHDGHIRVDGAMVHEINLFQIKTPAESQYLWDYYRLESHTPIVAVVGAQTMPGTTWFEGAQVNYARQVFRHVQLAEAANVPAIVAEDEQGNVAELSWSELQRRTASLALELRRRGVARGDRVAAWLPNIPEAVVAFLACASLGAIWTVCSPDMGTPAVLDRLRQTAPKVLIAVDGVFYGGRAMDRSAAVAEIRRGLPSVQTLLVIRSGFGESVVPDSNDFAQAQARNDEEVTAFEPE